MKTLRISDICKALGIHRQTLWRWVRQGKFPQPIADGIRPMWPADAVDQWIGK